MKVRTPHQEIVAVVVLGKRCGVFTPADILVPSSVVVVINGLRHIAGKVKNRLADHAIPRVFQLRRSNWMVEVAVVAAAAITIQRDAKCAASLGMTAQATSLVL